MKSETQYPGCFANTSPSVQTLDSFSQTFQSACLESSLASSEKGRASQSARTKQCLWCFGLLPPLRCCLSSPWHWANLRVIPTLLPWCQYLSTASSFAGSFNLSGSLSDSRGCCSEWMKTAWLLSSQFLRPLRPTLTLSLIQKTWTLLVL